MKDIVITGASRGIGRALALATAARQADAARLVLVARGADALDEVAREVTARGGVATTVVGDLGTLAGASALADRLLATVDAPVTLVHNAGLWPSKRQLTSDGFEASYAVNFAGPVVLQERLLAAGAVDRMMVVGAGLMVKGRFDPDRTPVGADFSRIRTYCDTKLAFALATRELAPRYPDVDIVCLHPGVVRTDLGTARGPLWPVIWLAKRFFERPEVCGERLARILAQDRWSDPGEALWMFEEEAKPWPEVTADPVARRAVASLVDQLAGRAASATVTG